MNIFLDFNNSNLRMIRAPATPYVALIWKMLNCSSWRFRTSRISVFSVDCLQGMFPPGSRTHLTQLQELSVAINTAFFVPPRRRMSLGKILTPKLISWKVVGSSQSSTSPPFPSIVANNLYVLKDIISTYHCKNLCPSLLQHIHCSFIFRV